MGQPRVCWRRRVGHACYRRPMANVGLVLSGGGARAAYQVGALRGLAAILRGWDTPFNIVTGLSAGAINGAAIGASADSFTAGVEALTETWMALTPESVYRTDTTSLTALGVRWLKDLTTGGVLGRSRANHLLDTSPLRELLTDKIDLGRAARHVQSGVLRGLAFSATNYLTGTTITFYDGAPELQPWVRYDRVAFRETLTTDHVMASAAIPVFFPPVMIDGKPFGDGGVRMTTPVSPAIHLGAEKIVAIGIRYARSHEQTLALNRDTRGDRVSAAQIAGVLLNALFLDSLDNDLERLQRINRTLSFVPEGVRKDALLRPIPALLLRPSEDLGRLAADEYERFPAMLRHLLRGVGGTGQKGWDLLSYLAFQPGYVGKLIELGENDTLARRAEIEAFFGAPPPPAGGRGAQGSAARAAS
jgi:NTE family protein